MGLLSGRGDKDVEAALREANAVLWRNRLPAGKTGGGDDIGGALFVAACMALAAYFFK